MVHVSKKDQLDKLLKHIESITNRNNVDSVLRLLNWFTEKIPLVIAAETKKELVKQARREHKAPPSSLIVSRGEIWQAKLGTNVGSEQNGDRPVLIIQNDGNNRKSPNTIIVPLSKVENRNNSSDKPTQQEILDVISKLRPTEILLHETDVAENEVNLTHPSIVLGQNIREISKERLRFKITKVSNSRLEEINNALKQSLGLVQP